VKIGCYLRRFCDSGFLAGYRWTCSCHGW